MLMKLLFSIDSNSGFDLISYRVDCHVFDNLWKINYSCKQPFKLNTSIHSPSKHQSRFVISRILSKNSTANTRPHRHAKLIHYMYSLPAKLPSACSVTLPLSSTSLNAGQPQPESYFVSELNSSWLHTTQM